jgi:hypothetical protein
MVERWRPGDFAAVTMKNESPKLDEEDCVAEMQPSLHYRNILPLRTVDEYYCTQIIDASDEIERIEGIANWEVEGDDFYVRRLRWPSA